MHAPTQPQNTLSRFLGCFAKTAALALAVLAAALPLPAQTSATGTITGRVQNAVTGDSLNNARVSVKGTNIVTLTDEGGTFQLNNVPAGNVTIRTFFTGLDEQEATVTVAPGASVEHNVDLTSKARYGETGGAVQLDKFVVASTKETNASAIAVNEQRVAKNIKSVVAAQEFGTIPDTNPGELLKWLPGVGVEYFANNVTGVNVRGLGSVNTEINFDGMPMASANADGTGRAFEVMGSSAADIARVEVRKLPLPENSANSIGGSINLIRRSAFEYSKRKVEYQSLFTSGGEELGVGSRAGPRDRLQNDWQPNWQIKWTEPVNKNLGFALTVGQNIAIVPVHWNNPTWNYGSAAQRTAAEALIAAGQPLPNTVSLYNPAMLTMLLHDAPTKDSKDYAKIRADWRPFPALTLGYSFSYDNALSSQGDDIRYTWNLRASGSADPQFVDRRTVVGPANVGQIAYNTPLWRDVRKVTNAHQFESSWKKNGFTAVAIGAFSASKNYIQSSQNGYFNSTSGGGLPHTGIGTGTGNPTPITVTFRDVDYRGPRQVEARDASGNLIDWSRAENAGIGGAVDRPGRALTDLTAARLYVKKDFNFTNPFSLQLGYDFAEEYKNRRYAMNVWKFVGADHVAATADDRADQIKMTVFPRNGDRYAHTPELDHISLSRLYKLYQDHPDWFQYDENQSIRNTRNNTYHYTETNYAPYLQFSWSLMENRLQFQGGVRYEKNDAKATGILTDQNAAYQKYSNGKVKHAGDVVDPVTGLPTTSSGAPVFLTGVTSGSVEEAKLILQENGAEGRSTIDNYFPSLHSVYTITPNMELKVGFAKTQAKNRLDRTVIPNTTINDTIQSNGALGVINLRNVNLQPWVGYNYEAQLSYYTPDGGDIAVSLFRKNIHNWQANITTLITDSSDAADFGISPQYIGYNVSSMFNNGNARIDGAEFEMRQPLDRILPHWAKGVTASVTYSYTNLIGQAPNSDLGSVYDYRGTVFLTYSHKKFKGSIGYLRNGPNSNGVNTAAGVTSIQTQVPQDMFDFSAEYRFARYLQVFASGKNILGEWRLREVRYPGIPNYAALNSSTNLGITFTVGIKGEF